MNARTTFRLAVMVAAGSFLIASADDQPLVVAPIPNAPGTVRGIKVLPDMAPDCTSLKTIVDTITRGCKNNDEKAVAVYNFMILTHYHRQYPSEPGGIPVLKEINCYGWSLCGGLHSTESALWKELGWGWRFVGWSNPGHTTVEAQYDNGWHYLDAFLKFYAWMPNGKGGRTIAGEDDLAKDTKGLIMDAFVLDPVRKAVYAKNNQFVMNGGTANWQAPAFLSCLDPLSGVESGIKSHNKSGSAESWMGINHATGSYSADVNLAPGFCMENTWDSDALTNNFYWNGGRHPPCHTCGQKETRNDPAYGLIVEPYLLSKPARSYANGTLTLAPDFSSDAVLSGCVSQNNVQYSKTSLVPADSIKPGSVVFNLTTPYIIVKAQGEADGADTVETSIDGGKTYQVVDLKDFTSAVKKEGAVSALVRVSFKTALKSLKIVTTFQNNPGALPFLSPGPNKVTVSAADAKALGKNKLVVTYAYRLGGCPKSFDQLCSDGKMIANPRQNEAHWDDATTYVRKTFKAQDLPSTFSIDCPTPQGEYPVYPRMVFLRREIIGADGTPSALPDGAVEAKPAPAERLKTLPNPFLIGCALPTADKAGK